MSKHDTRDFVKMHGLGNDFVIFDGREDGFRPSPRQAARVADRHFGVGCDQVITLEPSSTADLFMRIQNPDGSESGACGNATRCVAALVLDETGGDQLVIETLAGLLACTRLPDGRVTVDMGVPRLDWTEIPLARAMDSGDIDLQLADKAGHQLVAPVGVNMGNPHAVFFVADAEAIDLPDIGPRVEHNPLFPERVNVSVASLMSRAKDHTRIRVRVWERGAGITLACGSASCAVIVAATRRGLADGRATIVMDGGELELQWREDDTHVLMTGPTALVFRGAFPLGDTL
ncbi:diaminopimelate epimerase [Govanella unica]|uniref:Diaminopimelate epimerase n=1 Tax=Govanella unica TaxID=2975056 RepID=A0A9X3Z633_9PROT|nr:diaminopimelate epimerase [Govania unica]MDA5192721.1 diaminopimelate epimerase [Govania unica]